MFPPFLPVSAKSAIYPCPSPYHTLSYVKNTNPSYPPPPPPPPPPSPHTLQGNVLSLYNIQCDNTVSMQTLVRAQCNFMPLECSQPSVIGRGQTITEAFNLSFGLGGEWCKLTQYHFRASNRISADFRGKVLY